MKDNELLGRYCRIKGVSLISSPHGSIPILPKFPFMIVNVSKKDKFSLMSSIMKDHTISVKRNMVVILKRE